MINPQMTVTFNIGEVLIGIETTPQSIFCTFHPMNLIPIALLFLGVSLTACDPEPTGPEMNCQLQSSYDLGYSSVYAGKVFDISQDPPKEIRDGKIEYTLANWFALLVIGSDEYPPPYDEYFLKEVDVIDDNSASIFSSDQGTKTYSYLRNDCHIDFFNGTDTIHGELTKGGDEICFEKYAIYDYWTKSNGFDTVSFIQFRNKDFKSYEQIIADFARDHAGEYDTVTLERVVSKTKE